MWNFRHGSSGNAHGSITQQLCDLKIVLVTAVDFLHIVGRQHPMWIVDYGSYQRRCIRVQAVPFDALFSRAWARGLADMMLEMDIIGKNSLDRPREVVPVGIPQELHRADDHMRAGARIFALAAGT